MLWPGTGAGGGAGATRIVVDGVEDVGVDVVVGVDGTAVELGEPLRAVEVEVLDGPVTAVDDVDPPDVCVVPDPADVPVEPAPVPPGCVVAGSVVAGARSVLTPGASVPEHAVIVEMAMTAPKPPIKTR